MPNTYPTFKQLDGASETWVDDMQIDRSTSGAVKVRALFPAKKKRFKFRHILTRAERDTLDAFYDANRIVVFYFVWDGDGALRTCLFDGAPQPTYNQPFVHFDVAMVEQ